MGDAIAGVYSDARSEYTKQLCGILVPSYFQFYLSVLEKAREETVKQSDPKKLLWHFQTFLNEIPDWNMEKVNTEIGQIQSSCGCDYLEDLLTAVFIAHTKVLTAICGAPASSFAKGFRRLRSSRTTGPWRLYWVRGFYRQFGPWYR